MVVQKFTFETSVDGKVFYKGNTSFGWFLPEDMVYQKGLDGGKVRKPWHLENKIKDPELTNISLDGSLIDQKIRPRDTRLQLFDQVLSGPKIGNHSKGYVFGSKTVDPKDWFFSCHFWLDPVMPGSLGIEAYVELLEYYCLSSGIWKKFKQTQFKHVVGSCYGRYGGGLVTKNRQSGVDDVD